MKIKKYKTGQFAGIMDRDIEFSDGMNVIVGDNEAGKSTMIAGIYSTLFQPADTKKSSSGYKNFVELYKPSGKDISDGIYIDGDVVLDMAGSEVQVSKTWFSEPSAKVSVDKTGYKSKGAEEKLSELLKYGAAFYSNVVFGMQSNEELVLKWIFDVSDTDGKAVIKKKMSEYTSVIGGIDINRLQAALRERMSELDGRWDFEMNAPMKDRGRIKDLNEPWKNSVGRILETYYTWKRAEHKLDEVRGKVAEIQRLDDDLALCEQEQKKTQQRLDYIVDNKVNLHNRKANTELLQRIQSELSSMEQSLFDWPGRKEELLEIESLMAQLAEREKRQKHDKLEAKLSEIKELKVRLDDIDINERSMKKLDKAYDEAGRIEAELSAMERSLMGVKFKAQVKPLNNTIINVESADGTRSIKADETLSLNGYIKLDIPEVAEMVVDTDGINSEMLRNEIDELKAKLEAILSEYNVKTTKKLAEYRKQCSDKHLLQQRLSESINAKLEGKTIKEMEKELASYEIISELDISSSLDAKVYEYKDKYRAGSLDAVKALVEKRLKEYEESFGNEENLKLAIDKKKKDKTVYEKRLSELPQLAENDDFEEQEERLRDIITELSERYKTGFQLKSRLAAEIDEMDIDELKDEASLYLEEHKKRLNEYRIYSRIERDFLDIKDSMGEKPTDKLMSRMSEYLSTITLDGVHIENMGENLSLALTSRGIPVNSYKLLSEGTKSTILLAFKLAVLDFFFEDEGGVIVLDDILLDMDPARRMNSAKLLCEFAKHNQVIFMTCEPAMADMLGGNIIEL